MSPEIPAEAAQWQEALPYEAYRCWWITNVTKQAVAKPEPATVDDTDPELG